VVTPQPIGVLPWPAGLLLLQEAHDPAAEDTQRALVAGGAPEQWPDAFVPMRLALEGDVPAAAAALDSWPDDAVARYNRAVLLGDAAALSAIVDDLQQADAVRGLAHTARYTMGSGDAPPSPSTAVPGEVAAVMLSARASQALEDGHVDAAVRELEAAAESARAAGSPLLASALYATTAETVRDRTDDPRAALRHADAAVEVLPAEAPGERRAEAMLVRGVTRYHAASTTPNDLALMSSAVGDLQAALQTFREDRHPDAFAQASQYLALCYLMLPMSGQGDRIRVAVAVSSLRAALRVMTPQTHGEAWVSAQLNLANALQYLPSSHTADNLVEAVELYEQLLDVRDRAADPDGYARLLANQGNALAHLGIHAHAQRKLVEARRLFADVGDADAVSTVDQVLAELDRVQAG
jgi:tetratricopeptide (TPR) repeat protein